MAEMQTYKLGDKEISAYASSYAKLLARIDELEIKNREATEARELEINTARTEARRLQRCICDRVESRPVTKADVAAVAAVADVKPKEKA